MNLSSVVRLAIASAKTRQRVPAFSFGNVVLASARLTNRAAIMPASSSLRRSASAPRYQPLPDKNSVMASSRGFPLISVASCSLSFVATPRRAFAFDSGFHTTAIFVPARFSHASLTLESRSSSKSSGLARLPQPICGAAGHCRGASKMLTRSGDGFLGAVLVSSARTETQHSNPPMARVVRIAFIFLLFLFVGCSGFSFEPGLVNRRDDFLRRKFRGVVTHDSPFGVEADLGAGNTSLLVQN